MAAPIEDMTDIELYDELAELLEGPSFEQDAVLYSTRLSCERACKRWLAKNRARQEWALQVLRAEEMAGGPVDIPPPPWP
jgi:hypothetical protein